MDKSKIVVFNVNITYMGEIVDQLFFYCCKQSPSCSLMEDIAFHINNNFVMKSKPYFRPIYVVNSDNCVGNSKPSYLPIRMMELSKKDFMDSDYCEETRVGSISHPHKKVIINMNGYAVSTFIQCLTTSPKYLELVSDYISQMCYMLWELFREFKIGGLELQINLREPNQHVMDLKWAKMASVAIQEIRQLQYALSWLSTLGGAFSALGEQQERFAINAGMISIQQLRLAMKLGDAIIITQCKLYFSLSLIQRGYCRLAKKIIHEQYTTLKTRYVFEKKTINMCKGIWARLKYEMHRCRLAKNSLGNLHKKKTILNEV